MTKLVALENISTHKEDAALLNNVGNVLLFESFVVDKLKFNTRVVITFVGMLKRFSVFKQFCKGKKVVGTEEGTNMKTLTFV